MHQPKWWQHCEICHLILSKNNCTIGVQVISIVRVNLPVDVVTGVVSVKEEWSKIKIKNI